MDIRSQLHSSQPQPQPQGNSVDPQEEQYREDSDELLMTTEDSIDNSFMPDAGYEKTPEQSVSTVVSKAGAKTDMEEKPSKSNKDSPKSQEKVELTGAKHGTITNIKDFLQKQKGSAKRKSSKTPAKNKDKKIQKAKKGN